MPQKTQYINELTPGDQINDIFLLASASLSQSRNGPYWNLVLQDRTGKVNAKIWNPKSQEYPALESGTVAGVLGWVESYRDQPQIKVDNLILNPIPREQIDFADFLPSSEVPPQDLLEQMEDMITEYMKHGPWKKFCRKLLRSEDIRNRLLTAPGAKTVHHAYVGGLLEHSLNVARLCMSMCDVYPDLDRQTLLAGALFHDLGKAWELSGGPENDYTDAGRLMGHIQLGLEKLEPFLAKTRDLDQGLKLHFKHLITSHHGEHEFGSPVRPKTAEAFALHFADNMDAKMNIIGQACDEMDKSGQEWSPYMRFLERNIHRAPRTPDSTRKNSNSSENQCLLPLKG